MKRIYLLGSLNMDLTIRAPRLPEGGETVCGGDFLATPGGKGANQAYAAAALGGEVCMAGAVGEDPFGERLLQSLAVAGVDTQNVRRTKKSTGVAVITVIDGENRIVLDAGANGEVCERDVDALLQEAWAGDIFAAQLESPLPVVKYALQEGKKRGLFTVLNPAPAQDIADMVPLCDLIIPNKRELFLLTGEEDVETGCQKLLQMGAGGVIVTLGEEGALIRTETASMSVPAVKVGETVDTTAAGDTFVGALLVKLAEGSGVSAAAKFASLCAGIAVTRRGAQKSVPFRSEAERIAKTL